MGFTHYLLAGRVKVHAKEWLYIYFTAEISERCGKIHEIVMGARSERV